MGLNQINCWLLLLLVCLSVLETSPDSNFFSDGEFGSRVFSQRRLLQTKRKCPIDFENQNYTIITSQCKPKYTSEECCPAFKQFACPFVEELNDPGNDCADTMYSYIYMNKIPRGLFASLCRNGVTCPAPTPMPSLTENAADSSSSSCSWPVASAVCFRRAIAVVTCTTIVFIL